ncbi:hypothetical protein AMECASPLE_022501 [Ameca splendens]|uniref:Uncharacterized protein n=1 Tax=Ameca splendens TaxID=208324 RepID=A0ABV1A1I6_9TELE
MRAKSSQDSSSESSHCSSAWPPDIICLGYQTVTKVTKVSHSSNSTSGRKHYQASFTTTRQPQNLWMN